MQKLLLPAVRIAYSSGTPPVSFLFIKRAFYATDYITLSGKQEGGLFGAANAAIK